jgi:hypothetical protein
VREEKLVFAPRVGTPPLPPRHLGFFSCFIVGATIPLFLSAVLPWKAKC